MAQSVEKNANPGSDMESDDGSNPRIGGSLTALMMGATGVVFGDIGTSPLYAVQAIMTGAHPLPIDITNIYGVISLIFWTMIVVVTIKYVFIVMRCDNHGEGGSLALLALINRKLGTSRGLAWLVVCGLLATALFYADSMLTPAISVISAVEGLDVVSTRFHPYIVPIALMILIGLFVIQSHGTERVGKLFGPIMLVYFLVIAGLGIVNIVPHPQVLWEPLNPWYIFLFFQAHPLISFLSLSAVVYAITGVEALYADMGHFGRIPITYAWLYIVMPALILNYMGQASLLIRDPSAAANPFFYMAPKQILVPLVVLATMATVIASQAVISGAFSVTQQAIQLGYMPRFKIKHTSSHAAGQIYMPSVNWFLAFMVAALVITFKSSAAMLPAYGLAVVGTMLITTAICGDLPHLEGANMARRLWPGVLRAGRHGLSRRRHRQVLRWRLVPGGGWHHHFHHADDLG
jgi:KUP system potassium uptake protein